MKRPNPVTNVLSKVQVSDFEMVCVLGIGPRGKVLFAHDTSSSELYALEAISKRRVLASREVRRTLTEQAVLLHMAIERVNPFVAKLRSFYDVDHLYLAMVRLTYMLNASFPKLRHGYVLLQDFYPGGDQSHAT